MKVIANAFTMAPTSDLASSVAAYLSGGLEVLWRPDPQTALLGTAQRGCVMIEDDATERALGPGPVLLVDDLSTLDVDDEKQWAISPINVPVGRYAAVDRAGAVLRYLDLSGCEDKRRTWFGADGDVVEFRFNV
jgi:hypothetical protein